MTLPSNDMKTLLKTVLALWVEASKAGMSPERFAADIGVSTSTIYSLKKYKGNYRPGRYVEQQFRAFVKKIRQKRPESVEK